MKKLCSKTLKTLTEQISSAKYNEQTSQGKAICIDDFRIIDAIDEISVRGCKLDFGPA